MSEIRVTKTIAAPASQVYRAFTNSTSLREWLSEVATTMPREGGRFYLCWDSGYYTSGEYTSLTPDECVEFDWFGRGEPGKTHVKVEMIGKDGKTDLTLTHSGLGDGSEWAPVAEKFRKDWERSLENLQSVLETGEDLRITRRPMLGITLSDFDADRAAQLGVPVTEGMRLDSLVEGMGAQKAGLQPSDVIVGLNDSPAHTYPLFGTIISRHRAGDTVKVTFYRGPQKMDLDMVLSARPLPDIPWEPEELAKRVEKQVKEGMDGLKKAFDGYSEDEASKKPAPKEWSAKEVLAHLIHGERDSNDYYSQIVSGHEPMYDDFGGNSFERGEATVKAYGTVQSLLDELERLSLENVELFRTLPASFVQYKPGYWRLAYGLLQFPYHTSLHTEQIRAALEAARQ